jgi:uncharacterized protein involved in outer membrane biogenesis
MVKEATGRELNLGGEINLAVGFSPALVVTDITLANASWGSQPQMVKIDELQAQVGRLPLLARDVELRYIGLRGVDVLLETDKTGHANWYFSPKGSSAGKTGTFKLQIPTQADPFELFLALEGNPLCLRLPDSDPEKPRITPVAMASPGSTSTLPMTPIANG